MFRKAVLISSVLLLLFGFVYPSQSTLIPTFSQGEKEYFNKVLKHFSFKRVFPVLLLDLDDPDIRVARDCPLDILVGTLFVN